MKRILLTAGVIEPVNYIQALTNSGAAAAIATPQTALDDFDGLLLCGGGDVNPVLYGQENQGSQDISDERDQLELMCIDAFMRAGKPILGICRGMQILNVALGGTLIQHLSTSELHTSPDGDKQHPLTATGLIAQNYGSSFISNSRHHQAVDRLGRDLVPEAYSEDGVIEAVVHASLPILGVQFHPERMEDGAPIFKAFLSKM